MMNLLRKIFESLKWRLGLKDQELLLKRLEEKTDFLLKQICSGVEFAPMRENIISRTGNPVVFISDRNYFEPTLVAIHSLCRHAEETTQYRIFLIITDCTDEEIALAESLFPGIEIISRLAPSMNIPLRTTHVTSTALLKFELAGILPDCDQVLYLDGDIVVKKDLSPLFRLNLKDDYVAAVPDFRAMYEMSSSVSANGHGFYFNSGVLLLNLKQFRMNGIQQKLIRARAESKDFHFVDQDCLNNVLRGKIRLLPLEYNVMADNLAICFIPLEILAEQTGRSFSEIQQAIHSPAICHYGSPKPWNSSRVFKYGAFLEEKECLERHRKNKVLYRH